MIPNSLTFHAKGSGRTTHFTNFVILIFCLLMPVLVQANCDADAGTLGTSNVCLTSDNAIVSASPNGDAIIPEGFVRLFVLTSGEELVIEQVSPLSSFEVEAAGLYTIHTLIFDPTTLDLGIVEFGTTTGVDVNGLLVQGGGDICAALDVSGVKFTFDECQGVCNAYAGTLKTTENDCFEEGQTRLTAEHLAGPIAPEGFSVIYVLTSGEELTIQNVNDSPTFVVDGDGRYTIHTLVYDPATLDLGIVEFGTTTGVVVNGLLVQGGGDICAALDVAGAVFEVESCTAELACKADFGKLKIKTTDCIDEGQGKFEAMVKDDPTVPEGFELIYVLTSGEELVIQNVNSEPSFDITEEGLYTIHTLVYDPASLDLGIVELGITTGVDVNGLLIQGGGDICAALDVSGVSARFKECAAVCEAYSGRLTPKSKECTGDGNKVRIEARKTLSPRLPSSDFQIIYVLTTGINRVILDVNDEPVFVVDGDGRYTIHTLVYDPATLDLGIVEFGKTTGRTVENLLIEGGGDICGSLDLKGAIFFVDNCNDECTASFGALKPNGIGCYNGNSWVRVSAKLTTRPSVPRGYRVVYVLTQGENLVIRAASYFPVFFVKGTGRVTIHTLVYNPKTLDPGIIEAGKTTGVDVNKLLIQGGGDICAALDVAGAQFNISSCGSHLKATNQSSDAYQSQIEVALPQSATVNLPVALPNLNVQSTTSETTTALSANLNPVIYPNPSANNIQVDFPTAFIDKDINIEVMDTNGQVIKSLLVKGGNAGITIDISDLANAIYTIRLRSNDGTISTGRFSKLSN